MAVPNFANILAIAIVVVVVMVLPPPLHYFNLFTIECNVMYCIIKKHHPEDPIHCHLASLEP